jgi:uncharacterized protein YegL
MTKELLDIIKDSINTEKECGVYILLDASGSMSGQKWEGAISSANDYVAELQKEKIIGTVSVFAFDSDRYDTLRDNQIVESWKELSVNERTPSGSTPLYDSAARMIDQAMVDNNKKTIIIINTDGYENASREYSLINIKSRINDCKEKGWEVIFLGSQFKDVEEVGAMLGLDSTKMYNTVSNIDASRTMNSLAIGTINYARSNLSIDTTILKSRNEGDTKT